jgi:hypothetical protein
VAARFMGGDKAEAAVAAAACVESYRRRMRRYAEMSYLEVWYDSIDEQRVLDTLSPRVRRDAERTIAKARAKGHIRSLDKLTEMVGGEPRIVEDLPLIVRETHSDNGTPIRKRWTRCWAPTSSPCRSIAAACWRAIASSTRRARWWAWAVSAPPAGSYCCRASMRTIRCSLQFKEARRSVLAPY